MQRTALRAVADAERLVPPRMRIQFYLGTVFAVLIGASMQDRSDGLVPDPHKHVVAVHEKPWKTDLAPELKISSLEGTVADVRDSVFSPNGQWLVFVFGTQNEWARVGFEEMHTGKRYHLVNLPLSHRPINDIVWIDSTLVAFDRWSPPQRGMHYILDVQHARLALAVPFPDEVFLRQQRDTIH